MSAHFCIDVVIAWHQRHIGWCTHCRQPCVSRVVFSGQSDVDQVAGDRDVVGSLRLHIGNQSINDTTLMYMLASALPVDEAKRALRVPMARRKANDRAQVHIGEVRDGHRFGHRLRVLGQAGRTE